jgi:D-alanine-D-alanine ligase
MRILVLSGGTSDERDVSLRSGTNVTEALERAGYETKQYDPGLSEISLLKAIEECDVVFSALHGSGGEDGTMQSQLERLGIPYVGSNVYASELCFDKWNYRALLQSHDLPVARGELVDAETFWKSDLITRPFILKPPKGGSSIDTILVRNPDTIDREAIEADFKKHRQLLLEELIEGTEITVGILGNSVLPVIEIIPPENAEFDYENKYNGASQELCPPQHVSDSVQEKAQALALRIHELCDCKGMSRTDMMINDAGDLFVLETNTIPGMTKQSLLPKAADTGGINMPQLVDRLVKDALVPTGPETVDA